MGDFIEIADDYEHYESDNVEYILENILQDNDGSVEFKELESVFNSCYTNQCNCSAVLNDICENQTQCKHGGNYSVYSEVEGTQELVLNRNRVNIDLIFECHSLCKCATSHCRNRLVQNGPRKHLQIINYVHKGLGLTSLKFVPKGGFICEYAGEILTRSEALKRNTVNDKENKMNYILCLNEAPLDGLCKTQTFVDPSKKGNIGRYLNHSCDPNCEVLSVRIDNPIPKIGLFAKRDIEPNEELCFDYSSEESGTSANVHNKKRCYCKSLNCRIYLPNASYN